MEDLVYIGYITGPFGLKGELKIFSESNHIEKIFKIGNKLYIESLPYIIDSYRFHKHHLVTLKNFQDINDITNLIKKEVFVNRKDLNLDENEYLYIDLLGCQIIDEGTVVGTVDDLLYNKNTMFLKSDNLIIPVIEKYVEKVDTNSKIVYVKGTRGLML